MKKILPLELMGKQQLDYDLYDKAGNVLYKQGDSLTPAILMQLNYKEIYIQERNEVIKPESKLIMPDKEEIQSIISGRATESLLKNTKSIMQKVMSDEQPEISVCEEARDIILDEVADKIEEIDCIGQLRVFDEYTFSHTVNVSSMCAALGVTLGLNDKDLEDLAMGALLHDIGKMKVPKEILNKPGKLTDNEFKEMKNHTVYGYQIVKNEMNLAENIALIALEHQERYGGGGYPNGHAGKEISHFAQITAIADVYDALVSKRVYKNPLPSHEAIKIMLSEGGKSFNPFMLYKFVYLANYKNATNLEIKDEDKENAEKSQA